MDESLPCVNCITLAICRGLFFDNPDNISGEDAMIARYTISNCRLAVNYLYIVDGYLTYTDDDGSPVRRDTKFLSAIRLHVLTEYFKHLIEGDLNEDGTAPM
jgi:hypothetical protein